MKDARRKADDSGTEYFFTWNVNDLVLWKLHEPNIPLRDRKRVPYSVTSISSSEELAKPEIQKRIKEFLLEFLREFAEVYLGAEFKAFPLDASFITLLESNLKPIIIQTTSSLLIKYKQNKTFARHLIDWMVHEQGWHFVGSDESLPDELERAAKLGCYILVIKLVFYEVLRKYFPELNVLEISSLCTTGESLKKELEAFIEDAKEKSKDYETIFSKTFGDEIPFVPDETVDIWQEFISQIEAYDFSTIDYDVIGIIFEKLTHPKERHKYGQYFTSPDVCDLINGFCVRNHFDLVLDPACGGGTFLVRAYARKKQRAGDTADHAELLRQLYGIDIAQFACHLSTINLATKKIEKKPNYPRIIKSDFFEVFPEQRIKAGWFLPVFESKKQTLHASVKEEEKEEIVVPLVDAIVGNPPYIKHGAFENKKKIEGALVKDFNNKLPEISGRSDIYVYFWFHAKSFLKSNGFIGLLTSHLWLDVDYGKSLQKFFLDNFKIVTIIQSKVERWFEEASIDTAITILQDEPNKAERDKTLVKFVQIIVPLKELIVQTENEVLRQRSINELVKKILETKDISEDESLRIYPKLQSELQDESVDENKNYIGAQWGKYLRAPKVLFELLEKSKTKFTFVSNVATVRRGFTSGANEFFYVNDVTGKYSPSQLKEEWGLSKKDTKTIRVVESGDGSRHLVEANFLRSFIFSLKELPSIKLNPKTLKNYYINCNQPKSSLKNTKILDYIRYGESQKFHERPTCRSRNPWYSLAKNWQPAPLIFPAKVGEKMLVLKNKGVLEDKKLYGITPTHKNIEHVLLAILNSTWTRFYMEMTCRQLTGAQPIADIDVKVVENLKILNPLKINSKERRTLLNKFTKLTKRPILSVFEELSLKDRQDFDLFVLKLMGFTDKKDCQRVQDELYEALVDLIRNRLAKAVSVGKNKNNANKKVQVKIIASELWKEVDKKILKKFPDNFVSELQTEEFEIPEGEANIGTDLFTRGSIMIGEKVFKLGSVFKAEYVDALIKNGAVGSVQIPKNEKDAEEIMKQYKKYQALLKKELNKLAESRSADKKIVAKIGDELEKLAENYIMTL